LILHEDPDVYKAKMEAARKGCCECRGPVRIPPAGAPFSAGPYKGLYRCGDCWTVYWAEHPEDLADRDSVEYCRAEARRLRAGRISQGAELIHAEGPVRALLTERGTLLFDLPRGIGQADFEFDPERFGVFSRAIRAVWAQRIPGFESEGP
jgi:hypothetical protein